MLLKEMVESLSGKSMDAYLDSVFYKPMGLTHTAYNPTKRFNKSDIVPTSARDYIRRIPLQGEVTTKLPLYGEEYLVTPDYSLQLTI